MSETLKTLEVNAETLEAVERELTVEEIADIEILQAEAQTKLAESEAKAAARESALAKLAELGLTAEEIAAL